MKKKKPMQIALLGAAGTVAFVLLLACANFVAGALLFITFGENPGKAQFTTIEQAYTSNPDARAMKKIKGSAMIALLLCLGGPIGLGLLVYRKKSDLFGHARFASSDDISEEKLDVAKGVVIGKFKKKLLRLGGYDFVLLAAPTRTGKGVGFCVPNLLQFEDSAVVLDIKGENYNLTSEFRRRYMGNEIIYFNPFSSDTHRWNPLSYVSEDPNFRASDLMALATIIYPVNEKEPFWSDAAKNLFVGLGLLVLETPELPQTIGEILRQGSGKGQAVDVYLKQVLDTCAASTRPLSATCRDSLNRFINSGETALKGIVATFSATLTPFGNAVIDKATSANDFDLRDVRKKKMTIYLNIPAGEIMQASFIVNVFFSQLINENVKELPEQNPALKYQCLLMLDEFTAMGKVAIIAKGVGYMAGYNMRLAIIIQDKSQIDAVYGKEDAHNIVSNMGAVIYFTPSQVSEAEEYSKMIGNNTVTSDSKQHTKGTMFGVKEGSHDSVTESYQSRAVMLPQELLSMSKDIQLIVRSGIPVIKADKIRYYDDPYFKERFNAVPMHEVTIGTERRHVPVPVKLPEGDWTTYSESIKSSEYYVSIAPPPVAAADTLPGAATVAPDKIELRAVAPAAPLAPMPVPPEEFEPFSALHSRLENDTPATPASTWAASAYAESIIRYWQAAQAAGMLHDDEALVILDLNAGRGQFAWQLLNCVNERLHASSLAQSDFQYIACTGNEDEQAALNAHPYFAAAVDEQVFFTALRDVVLSNAEPIFATNPVVVVGQGLMTAGDQEMLVLRGSEVFSVHARANRQAAPMPGTVRIETQLAAVTEDAFGPAGKAVLEMYRQRLGNAAIALPTVALRNAEDIIRISGGNFLWLSADPAIVDEREIRDGAFATPDGIAVPAPPIPANYHALAWYLHEAGVDVRQEKSIDSNLSLCIALADSGGVLNALMPDLQSSLDGVLNDEAAHVAALVKQAGLPLSDCLSLLQRRKYDPRFLGLLSPALLGADWQLSPRLREQWQQALARTWAMYLPVADAYPFLINFSVLAIKAGHFGLARAACTIAVANHHEHPEATYMLAEAEHQSGRTPEAIAALRQALAQPHDPVFQTMLDRLEERVRLQNVNSWFQREQAETDDLRLEPLAVHHAEKLLEQFGDRQIAGQTMLPELATIDQAVAWIKDQSSQAGRMSCAVMHRDWGLVGAVSLCALADTACFYFWIGADYQGRGYGVKAGTAHLLMAQDHAGITEFFAASGTGNSRALSALAQIGFRPIDPALTTSGGAFGFLYIGVEQDDQLLRPRLAALCQAVGLPLATA